MKTVLATFVLLLATSVAAHEHPAIPDLSKVGRGTLVPNQSLGLVIGQPDQALLETATRLRAFTVATGFEACAQICQAPDGRLAFPMKTNFSQVGCRLVRSDPADITKVVDECPAGFVRHPKERGIHTHPEFAKAERDEDGRLVGRTRANPVDALHANVRRGTRLALYPETFSPGDKKNGPGGYLVAQGQLLYLGENEMITRLAAIGTTLPATQPSLVRPERPALLAEVSRALPLLCGPEASAPLLASVEFQLDPVEALRAAISWGRD